MNKLFNKALMVMLAAIISLSSIPVNTFISGDMHSPVAIVAQAASKKTHLNATKKTIYIGKNYTLKLIDKKGKTISASKVKWSTSKKSVASVSKKGVVTGKKAGKIKITATYKGKKYTATITVKSAVSLSKTKLTFKIGETAKKTIKVTRKDNNDIKWKVVSGKDIVKISQAKKWKNNSKNLYITPTGKKYGEVKIKVYSAKNSNSYVYLYVDVKAPYTLKVKNKLPCTINNYASELDYEAGVKKSSLKITNVSYKIPNTKTLNITLTFEVRDSLKLEDYHYIKYKISDKNGFVVQSGNLKSSYLMIGDRSKAEISLKNIKNGSYTIQFIDYISTSGGTTETTAPSDNNETHGPANTETPNYTEPQWTKPSTTEPTTESNKLTNKAIVDLYKNAMNSARTESSYVIRVKEGVLNYKGIIEAGSLSSVASTLMGMFMSPDEDSITETNEIWKKDLLPDASALTVDGLKAITYKEDGNNYIVTLVAKNAKNPSVGDDGVGSISNIIEEKELTEAVGSVPALKISNINMDYENVTAVATIDKASGKLIELKLNTPAILSLDAKLAVLSVQNARIGIQEISEYKINYSNLPGSTEPPTEIPTQAPTETPTEVPTEPTTQSPTETPTEPSTEPSTGNEPIPADVALSMYQKAAKDINDRGVAGYSKKTWQNIESFNLQGNSAIQSTMQTLIEAFLTSEEDAEELVNARCSEDAMRRMPISDCSKEYVKSVSTELDGENYVITIVMKDQTNPSYDDTDGLARMSKDFLDIKDVEDTIKNDETVSKLIKSLDNAEITYKSYTIKATMTKNGRFVSIEHFGPADISADMQMIIGSMSISGRMNFNTKYYNFKY